MTERVHGARLRQLQDAWHRHPDRWSERGVVARNAPQRTVGELHIVEVTHDLVVQRCVAPADSRVDLSAANGQAECT